jgi:hypothetical protein
MGGAQSREEDSCSRLKAGGSCETQRYKILPEFRSRRRTWKDDGVVELHDTRVLIGIEWIQNLLMINIF